MTLTVLHLQHLRQSFNNLALEVSQQEQRPSLNFLRTALTNLNAAYIDPFKNNQLHAFFARLKSSDLRSDTVHAPTHPLVEFLTIINQGVLNHQSLDALDQWLDEGNLADEPDIDDSDAAIVLNLPTASIAQPETTAVVDVVINTSSPITEPEPVSVASPITEDVKTVASVAIHKDAVIAEKSTAEFSLLQTALFEASTFFTNLPWQGAESAVQTMSFHIDPANQATVTQQIPMQANPVAMATQHALRTAENAAGIVHYQELPCEKFFSALPWSGTLLQMPLS